MVSLKFWILTFRQVADNVASASLLDSLDTIAENPKPSPRSNESNPGPLPTDLSVSQTPPPDGLNPSSQFTPAPLTPGQRFRQAVFAEFPLQIVGTIHALSALQAQRAGFRAIYLSGAGVANASHALPDLGITHLEDVLEDARRITLICDLPLLVDIDTGWGTEGTIARTIRELERVDVGDAEAVRHEGAGRRAAARPDGDAAVAGRLDEVLNDQEIPGVSGLGDDAEFVLQPIGHRVGQGIAIAIDRAPGGQVGEEIVVVLVAGRPRKTRDEIPLLEKIGRAHV